LNFGRFRIYGWKWERTGFSPIMVQAWRMSVDAYESLNDAAVKYVELIDLKPGDTEIWYSHADGFFFGEKCPDLSNLDETHHKLGEVQGTELEDLFCLLQGEFWSPAGEANNLIHSKGLAHTSMSVGDVIVVGGVAHMVKPSGFEKLGTVPDKQ